MDRRQRRRHRHRRHHGARHRAARRPGLRRAAEGRHQGVARRQRGGGRVDQGRVRRVRAAHRRDRRVERRPRRAAAARQRVAVQGRLAVQAEARQQGRARRAAQPRRLQEVSGSHMSDLADLLGKEEFAARHLGSDELKQRQMLAELRVDSLDALVREVVPTAIRLKEPLKLGAPQPELQALAELSAHAVHNEVYRSYIGMGYYGTHTPAVIQRNVLENPGWYTAYTPYQAEISQGRLEALLNFQQLVIDLTGLPVANASLLDEATAAAEAMAMIRRSSKSEAKAFFVDAATHPQVLSVMRTRAQWLGIELKVGDAHRSLDPSGVFGIHLQCPDTYGHIEDWTDLIAGAHKAQALVCVGTDLLALLLLKSPGASGADVAIGSAQRFGVPMGYGGPHAAFMACRDEHKRQMPGRIIGVSRDAAGRPALRMALQTREQHIRRDKATSNICTAQALLANMATAYAIWHGPAGLQAIAARIHELARLIAACAHSEGEAFFDTVTFRASDGMDAR